MRLAALFSGGKDSTYAVYDSLKKGHGVACLVSLIPKSPESYMFHYPNAEYTKLQAESMGIPIIIRRTAGEKEKELDDMEAALADAKEKFNISGIVAGALASRYQKERVEMVAKKLNLELLAPQWNIEPEKYWDMLLDEDFNVMIIGVACEGLDKSWLGRTMNRQSLEELKLLAKKYRFHLAFEGGEAETFVTDCPIFKKRLEIQEARKEWSSDSGFYFFKNVKLVDK